MAEKRTLQLDHGNKKFLGVCAGLANYLGVEPWSIRLVFIGCVIFGGWFLIPMYFVAWFLMDEASSAVRSSITENLAVKHFRTVDYHKKIYRNTRDAKWLGVCAGIADYLEVNVFAVRMVFLLLFFTTGGLPLLLYLAAWMVLDKAPPEYYQGFVEPDSSRPAPGETVQQRWEARMAGREKAGSPRTSEELDAELNSKRREIKFCARKFVSLQNRLARMEAYVTSQRFNLHREFRSIQGT